MFTMVAHSASVGGSTTALTALSAVSDQSVRVSGNDIYVPTGWTKYIGSYAIGTGITKAQIVTPTLRQVVPIDVAEVDANATPEASKKQIQRILNPIDLAANETLDAYADNSNVGAQQETVFSFLADNAITPVTGKIFTIRFTLTGATGANNWTNQTITLSNQLPVGQYQCVGARFVGNNLLAARFVPIGAANRPGCIACAAVSDLDIPQFRFGGLGVWFEFDELTLPSVDFFATGATGTITGYLDLIKK